MNSWARFISSTVSGCTITYLYNDWKLSLGQAGVLFVWVVAVYVLAMVEAEGER